MEINCKLFSYENFFERGQLKTDVAEILQSGELSIIKCGEIPGHIQTCDEITYVVSGKGLIYSGEHVREVTAGQIHFIREGQYHRIVADEHHDLRYFYIGFLPNTKHKDIQVFLNAIKELDFFFVEDEGSIKTLLEKLLNEFYIRDEESNLMIHLYFSQMLILLYRILTGRAKEKLSKINRSTSNHVIYQALKYIDKEYLKITTVKQIAEALSYSEYHLSHIFKEKMDITIKDYLMQKKMSTATELLKNSNMSISEIAEQLHFSSLHSFGVAFKRYMHISASEFRQNSDILSHK